MGSALAEPSPVLKMKRPLRASAVRRTKLVFEKTKVGGVEALKEDGTPLKWKRVGEGSTEVADVAADKE